MMYGRLTRDQWEIYAVVKGIDADAAYRFKDACIKMNHKQSYTESSTWKYAFSNDSDSVTYKMFIGCHMSDNDWELFVDRNEVVINSPYDCTGKWFTAFLSRYELPNGTWVYHTMNCDC